MFTEKEAFPQYKNLPYRRGVGMMVLNKDKKVFVGKRVDNKNHAAWQMPQGGIDENETIEEAALRELREETSMHSVKILAETKNWLYYDLPEFLSPKLWSGKYRGQKQKWILMQFFGDVKEVDVNLKNQEFESWDWVDPKRLPDIVVDFKRKLYVALLEEFSPIIEIVKF